MSPTTHFGKYLLIDKIGAGGMAELYMAKQSGLKGFEKVMAIKRILPHLTQDSEFVSMFINEAKLAALLSHQNIVQIFDLGHIEGFYFIAMEYVMGKDLRTILQRAKALNQPLSIGHALLIMSKVCGGLDYAHRQKDLSGRDLAIVHRDISPQNILVSYEGEVKVVDFGIAKAATQNSETRTGVLKGKLSYMAPEQAWGKPLDCRADIFAIGIVLYEILTGRKLFKGDNEFNTLEKVREAQVDPLPSSLNNQVPPELEAIVLKALAREPADRYSTAAELQTAIEDLMSQKGFDQSTARLSQYLRKLFEYDIEQDTQRFMIATGASPAPVSSNPADQSTVVRPPSPPAELTPSHPSRRIRLEVPKHRSGPPVVRTVFLTMILMFGGAVLLSVNNPPFLQKIVEAQPEIGLITSMLARWPEQAAETVQTVVFGVLSSEEPAAPEAVAETEVSPAPSELLTEPPEPVPGAVLPDPASSTPAPVPPETAAAPKADEKKERRLTEAEKNEIRRLLEEAKVDYDEHRLGDVVIKLNRLIDLNPKVPMAYHLLGTVMLERKDTERARRIFEEASRNFPNYALLHYDLGFLYYQKGVVSLAVDELKAGLKIDASLPAAERAQEILKELEQKPQKKPKIRKADTAPPPAPASGAAAPPPEPAPIAEPPATEPAPTVDPAAPEASPEPAPTLEPISPEAAP